MSPKTPRHESAVRWLARWLMDAVDGGQYEIGVGSPLTIRTSEPEPDLTVVARDAPRPYHPSTATLVIEVAVSSLARDLGIKAEVYAAGAVDEYWVLDLDAGRMVVHRQPSPEGYAERFDVAPGQGVQSSVLVLPPLDLAALLRAAGG